MTDGATSGRRAPLRAGTKVEVRNRFDGSWSPGFEVAEVAEVADVAEVVDLVDVVDLVEYHVVRLSDGEVLPVPFAAADVRRERSRSTWWV